MNLKELYLGLDEIVLYYLIESLHIFLSSSFGKIPGDFSFYIKDLE